MPLVTVVVKKKKQEDQVEREKKKPTLLPDRRRERLNRAAAHGTSQNFAVANASSSVSFWRAIFASRRSK